MNLLFGKWIRASMFWLVSLMIVLTHFWSTQANVSPEPGAALSVYASYNAMFRMNGNESISIKPDVQYRSYLDNEVAVMEQTAAACSEKLQNETNRCIAGNIIEGSSRLQHWKSYIIPSAVAGIVFDSRDREELSSLSVAENEVPNEPSRTLYQSLRRSGLLFFNLLLFVKLAVWSVVWSKARNGLASVSFGMMFLTLSAWGLFSDVLLRRGAGVYAVDAVITGSPTFDQSISRATAMVRATVDGVKVLVAPAASSSILGLTPRSVSVFVVSAIALVLVLNRDWSIIWLTPLALGIHFTTSALLLLLLSFVLIALRIFPTRGDLPDLLGSSLLVAPLMIIQFNSGTDPGPEFSYWAIAAVGITIAVASFLFPIIRNVRRSNDSFAPTSSGVVVFVGCYSLLLLGTIWRLSRQYGFTDSSGFWVDGFLREAAGRAAPFVQSAVAALIVALWLVRALSQKFEESEDHATHVGCRLTLAVRAGSVAQPSSYVIMLLTSIATAVFASMITGSLFL